MTFGATLLALAIAAGLATGAAYNRQPPPPGTRSHHATAACTHAAITTALIAGNQQLKSFRWRLTSHACQSRWAVATVHASTVGAGIAFLRQQAPKWRSDPLNEGVRNCSNLPGSQGTALPPRALAILLLNKIGIC